MDNKSTQIDQNMQTTTQFKCVSIGTETDDLIKQNDFSSQVYGRGLVGDQDNGELVDDVSLIDKYELIEKEM